MNEVQVSNNAIDILENTMRLNKACTTDFEEYTEHYFGEGTYVREMRIPKNTVVVGKAHKYNEVCILLKGILLVKDEGSDEARVIEGPYTFTAGPGKKAVYILEDVTIVNIHPNPSNTRDLDQIEREVLMSDRNVLEVVS